MILHYVCMSTLLFLDDTFMSPHISLFSWANFSDETRAPAGGHMALRQLRQLMNLMDLMPQFSIHWWLVGGIPTPLKNDGLRQWKGWHPIYIYILYIYIMENKKNAWNILKPPTSYTFMIIDEPWDFEIRLWLHRGVERSGWSLYPYPAEKTWNKAI